MEIETIAVDRILVDDRLREDVGDTSDIEQTLKTGVGLIAPIAVKALKDGIPDDFSHKLIAGERRLAAHKNVGLSYITAHVYHWSISPLEELSVEIIENKYRKDLHWVDDIIGIQRLHKLLVEDNEEQIERGVREPTKKKWSISQTAEYLGYGTPQISTDIKLVESIANLPELARCKTKRDALNAEARMMENLILEEKANRARSEVGYDEEEEEIEESGKETFHVDNIVAIKKLQKKVMGSYKAGDFFDLVRDIPEKTFNFVDFDPDYGIEFVAENFGRSSSQVVQDLIMQDYQAVSNELGDYTHYIQRSLEEIWRVMRDDAWLIMWFSPEPWFEVVAAALEKQGFQFKRLPGIWFKDVDAKASMAPDRYLGRTYEFFFYARKGEPEISRRARSDVFVYKQTPNKDRVHPTSKPIELMQDILATFATPGQKVLVPHAGSGNTIFAAANLGMKALGIDISKAYKDSFDARCILWEPQL